MPRARNGAPWAVAGVAVAAVLATPAIGRAETLYDAIDLAYQSNPALRSQQAQQRATDETLVQARGASGLQVSLNGEGTYEAAQVQQPASPFFPATTTNYLGGTAQGSVTATQPLYTSGANRAGVQVASANVAGGKQTLRQAEAQLLLKVITAYEDVRLYRATIEVLREEIGELENEYAETKARGEKGDLTRTDVVEAEERTVAARAALVAVQGQLSAANAAYLNVVGQAPGELAPPPDLPGMPVTVDEAFAAADLENPQVLAAVDAEKAADAEVRQAKAAFGPTVSLQATAGISPLQTYAQPQYVKDAQVSVVAAMPLFTSGVNSSKVREARENDYRAQYDVDTAREAVVQQVATAWDQLLSSREAAALQTREIDLQSIAVKGNRIEQKVGLRSVIDMLNAEQELVNAEVGLEQSRHDEYVASATVLANIGRLEARFLTPETPIYDPAKNEKKVRDRYNPPWVGPELTIDSLLEPRGDKPAPGVLAPAPKGVPPHPPVTDPATAVVQ